MHHFPALVLACAFCRFRTQRAGTRRQYCRRRQPQFIRPHQSRRHMPVDVHLSSYMSPSACS
ncbi:hypothetical protein PILCRDRAFT_646378 [Piloderma croceum F 1598]|uniref:Uncharacterized protein n=1 Tax=Piloderma croceum (strain F 1598) TaxID=765440 RepID=A0A0C3F8T0_PILCF|nr:hypothetical protein PILCRDRAFT_646378 [Piloderma croceum F 1598]